MIKELLKLFHRKKVYKKLRFKWPKSKENHEAQFPQFSIFIGQKSIFRRYCVQNVKDGVQIQAYNTNNAIANNFGQFILVNVKKN